MVAVGSGGGGLNRTQLMHRGYIVFPPLWNNGEAMKDNYQQDLDAANMHEK